VEGGAASTIRALATQEVLRAVDTQVRIAAGELAFELIPRLKNCPEARAGLVTGLVLAQADPVGDVRRCADRAWRAASEAGSTPGKLLLELRPRLLERLASELCSGRDATSATAGRAAAQLESRLSASNGVLHDLVPDMIKALESEDSATQRSACMGIAEILSVEGCHKILKSAPLCEALEEALFSGDAVVRGAAATCAVAAPASAFWEPLLEQLGTALSAPSPDKVLGLEEVINLDKSGAGLAMLLAPPYGIAKVSCLAAAAGAPAAVLKQHASGIIVACVEAAASGATGVATATVRTVVRRFDADGVSDAISEAVSRIGIGQAGKRTEAATHVLSAILEAATSPTCDIAGTLDAIVPGVLLEDVSCAAAFANALVALTKLCGANNAGLVGEAVPRIHASLQGASEGEMETESFEAMMPLLQMGITGLGGQRRCAAEAISELLPRAREATLQTHALKAAGPLVRALTEKPVDVELQVSILAGLGALLGRAGGPLRPLVPALQTGLVRLLDGSPELQSNTTRVLAALARVAPKPEALIKALCKPPAQAPQMEALAAVLQALPPPRTAEVEKEAQAVLDGVSGKLDNASLKEAAANVAAVLKS